MVRFGAFRLNQTTVQPQPATTVTVYTYPQPDGSVGPTPHPGVAPVGQYQVIVVNPIIPPPNEPVARRWPNFWITFGISLLLGVWLSPLLSLCLVGMWRTPSKKAGTYTGSGVASLLWGVFLIVIASVLANNNTRQITCNRYTGECYTTYGTSTGILSFLYIVGGLFMLMGVVGLVAGMQKMRAVLKSPAPEPTTQPVNPYLQPQQNVAPQQQPTPAANPTQEETHTQADEVQQKV